MITSRARRCFGAAGSAIAVLIAGTVAASAGVSAIWDTSVPGDRPSLIRVASTDAKGRWTLSEDAGGPKLGWQYGEEFHFVGMFFQCDQAKRLVTVYADVYEEPTPRRPRIRIRSKGGAITVTGTPEPGLDYPVVSGSVPYAEMAKLLGGATSLTMESGGVYTFGGRKATETFKAFARACGF